METRTTLNIAREFSKFPAGRYLSDGEFSGERFRDDFLVPALRRASIVIVELDGTLGYGSSFLEEAFGGLVRDEGFTADRLRSSLELVVKNEIVAKTIWQYISEARAKNANAALNARTDTPAASAA